MTVRKSSASPFWYFDFWFKKRRYKGTTKQKSKSKAQDCERRLIYQLEHGRDPFRASPLIRELVPQYLSWLEGNNKTRQHVDRSRRALKNIVARLRGVKTLEEITPAKIQHFKAQRLREVAPNTVNLELRCLRAFFKRCVKQGWIQQSPVEVEMVEGTPGKLIFLSDDEINPLLDHLPTWASEAARFLILTGLRLDEARYLQWTDLDLDSGELSVRRKPELGFSPKRKKERTVPIPPELTEELRCREQKTGWVLRNDRGEQFNRRRFQRLIPSAARAAGLDKQVTPHTLRHTYGSRLVMAGVDLPTVKELMGHSDISTTMIYVHLTSDHKRQAVAKVTIPKREEQETIIPFAASGGLK